MAFTILILNKLIYIIENAYATSDGTDYTIQSSLIKASDFYQCILDYQAFFHANG